MKKIKSLLCMTVVFVICFCSFAANAAYETHENDVKLVCDLAVEYVNSGSDEIFEEYISEGIGQLISDGDFSSSKFVYLYEEDPEFIDAENNQLSKIVSVLYDVYVNNGDAEITQSDINKNVTPGYSEESGSDDYQDDDAEVFMEIIEKGKEMLKPANSKPETQQKEEKKDAMPPETNEDAEKADESTSGGTSLGVVILVSIIVSAIIFAACTYAMRQVDSKKKPFVKNGEIDGDEVYNLRLAVKSMQTSLQKADGNFKELDKLRIQVDEIDEKLEHITEYLRKINKAE